MDSVARLSVAVALSLPIALAGSAADWNQQSIEWQRKDPRKSREFATLARDQALKDGDRSEQARALILLGEAELVAANVTRAETYASQAEPLVTASADDRISAAWYLLRAKAAVAGDSKQAFEWIQKAQSLFEKTGDITGYADTLYTLGLWYRHQGRNAESLEAQQRGAGLREQAGDPGGKAIALQGIGLAYRSMSESTKAIAPFREAVAIHRELGDTLLLGRVLVNLSACYQDSGDLADALETGLEGLRVLTEIEDETTLSALNNLSSVYLAMGNREKALEFSGRILGEQQKRSDPRGLATAHSNIGLIYEKAGDYRQALAHFDQALAAAIRCGDKKLEALALGNIGFASHNAGDQSRALSSQTKALALREELKDRKGIAYSLSNLGVTNLALGRIPTAMAQLTRAVAIADELHLAQVQVDSYRDLARAHAAAGDHAEAYRAAERHAELLEAVMGEEANRRMSEIQARHDRYTTEKQVELLKQQSQIRDLDLKRKTQQVRDLLLLGACLCLLLVAMTYGYQNKRRANHILERAALTDPLTGLRNRRFFQLIVGSELKRIARIHEESPGAPRSDLLFFLLDLDHFKSVNDGFGHAAGDAVLRASAQRLQRSLRASDFIFRWGGEEFLVIARDCRAQDAPTISRNLMHAIGSQPFEVAAGEFSTVTVSIGFAPYHHLKSPGALGEDYLKLADRALYTAKQSGRNRATGFMPKRGAGELEQVVVTPEGKQDEQPAA